MRLRDLNAEFFGSVSVDEAGVCSQRMDKLEGAQGLMFQCPNCIQGDGSGHYILVCFSNPISARVAPVEYDRNPRWEVSGTSLDDLTLSPSINLDIPTGDPKCRWHGFVKNGDAA